MFSRRVPPEIVLHQVSLSGTRGGPWFPLAGADFGLGDEELRRRLPPSLLTLPSICGGLGAEYNARHPPPQRLTAMRARVRRIPRPGVPSEPFDQTVDCRIPPLVGVAR